MQLAIVCEAHYLGGSGGMPPQESFANLAYSALNLAVFLTEKMMPLCLSDSQHFHNACKAL